MKPGSVPGLLTVLGVVGVIATIRLAPDTPEKVFYEAVVAVLTAGAALYWVVSSFFHPHAFSILKACKTLGISAIHVDGKGGEPFRQRIASARNIKIIAPTLNAAVREFRNELVAALADGSAAVTILLGAPGSEFLADLDEVEGRPAADDLSDEVSKTEATLRKCLDEAKRRATGRNREGKITVGHYRTHFRGCLFICDDKWAWLTLSLPPQRPCDTPTLELEGDQTELLRLCREHFDRALKIAESRRLVHAISVEDSSNATCPVCTQRPQSSDVGKPLTHEIRPTERQLAAGRNRDAIYTLSLSRAIAKGRLVFWIGGHGGTNSNGSIQITGPNHLERTVYCWKAVDGIPKVVEADGDYNTEAADTLAKRFQADLSAFLDAAGTYTIRFHHESGPHALVISKIAFEALKTPHEI